MSSPITDSEMAQRVREISSSELRMVLGLLPGDSKDAEIVRTELAQR